MLTISLLLLGVVGFLGMTWLFPLVGKLANVRRWNLFRSSTAPLGSESETPKHVAILVPVHNEAQVLAQSLSSFADAIERANGYSPFTSFSIVVGVDGCTDESLEVAEFFGAEVIEKPVCQGKWRMLGELLDASLDADWVVLADAGAIWEEDFLKLALSRTKRSNVLAVAPTYRNGGGILEKVLWSVEQHFKNLESQIGGPVTMHGATCLYRREELVKVFKNLNSHEWLNDDVVLPMLLRASNPEGEILYAPELVVRDSELREKPTRREFWRRRRIVIGNVQWIRELLPKMSSASPVVGVLALRRVFRVFWAYWGLALGAGLFVFSLNILGVTTALVGFVLAPAMLYVAHPALRRVVDAAAASLMAPYYLLNMRKIEQGGWR